MIVCPKCNAELEVTYALSLTCVSPPGEPTWRRVPLKDMELSVRSENCLYNEHLATAGEIDDKTDGELLRIPNFGMRSLREVREQIARVKAEHEGLK